MNIQNDVKKNERIRKLKQFYSRAKTDIQIALMFAGTLTVAALIGKAEADYEEEKKKKQLEDTKEFVKIIFDGINNYRSSQQKQSS